MKLYTKMRFSDSTIDVHCTLSDCLRIFADILSKLGSHEGENILNFILSTVFSQSEYTYMIYFALKILREINIFLLKNCEKPNLTNGFSNWQRIR